MCPINVLMFFVATSPVTSLTCVCYGTTSEPATSFNFVPRLMCCVVGKVVSTVKNRTCRASNIGVYEEPYHLYLDCLSGTLLWLAVAACVLWLCVMAVYYC